MPVPLSRGRWAGVLSQEGGAGYKDDRLGPRIARRRANGRVVWMVSGCGDGRRSRKRRGRRGCVDWGDLLLCLGFAGLARGLWGRSLLGNVAVYLLRGWVLVAASAQGRVAGSFDGGLRSGVGGSCSRVLAAKRSKSCAGTGESLLRCSRCLPIVHSRLPHKMN